MAVAFARVLRGAGLRAPLGSVLTFVDALGKLRLDQREQVYWAGRATLVRNPEDIPLYDRTFEVFWLSARGLDTTEPEPPMHITLAVDDDSDDGDAIALRVMLYEPSSEPALGDHSQERNCDDDNTAFAATMIVLESIDTNVEFDVDITRGVANDWLRSDAFVTVPLIRRVLATICEPDHSAMSRALTMHALSAVDGASSADVLTITVASRVVPAGADGK